MYELLDPANRLIVVLPMRFRHSGRIYGGFVDGKTVADYRTFPEASQRARALAAGRPPEQSESAIPSETS